MSTARGSFVPALSAILAIALGLATTSIASAQGPNNPYSPAGLWSIEFFHDSTPAMTATATQKICFLANGTWFSTTFPNWHGVWFQKGGNAGGNGDYLRAIGNYAANVGNDSGELDFVNLNLMTGPWSEWRDGLPGSYVYWGRVPLRRVGKCAAGDAKEAAPGAAASNDNPGGRPKQ